MSFDVYLQLVLVCIRVFNYRPTVRRLLELRALKRTLLIVLCMVAGAFAIKGRGDAGIAVPILFASNLLVFVAFYGWFSQCVQFFFPCITIAQLWCFRESLGNRAPMLLRADPKPELISQAEIDALASERFDAASFAEQGREPHRDCAICLDPLLDGEEVNALACRHTFHVACMRTWLLRKDNPTCPTCRQDVRGPAHDHDSDHDPDI